jgi:Lhr-like helicase
MKAPARPTPLGRKAERALQRAVSRVIERNRRLGLPVAVMKNGRAVLVPVREARALARTGRGRRPG